MTLKKMEQTNQDAWWRDWFNQIYLDVYAHRDDETAEQEIRSALSFVELNRDDWILDLCCGSGRHCRALRRKGYSHVIGIDYSPALLRQAKTSPPHSFYVRADMRLLPLGDERIDAVFSFFTSFGYFNTNVENIGVLQEIGRVLKDKGWFLIDYLNADYVSQHIEAETTRIHGEYQIKERRSISDDGERVEKEIIIENWGGKEHRYFESVRLYSYDEMVDMLQTAGLKLTNALGSFDALAYKSDSPRMILYGQRMD